MCPCPLCLFGWDALLLDFHQQCAVLVPILAWQGLSTPSVHLLLMPVHALSGVMKLMLWSV